MKKAGKGSGDEQQPLVGEDKKPKRTSAASSTVDDPLRELAAAAKDMGRRADAAASKNGLLRAITQASYLGFITFESKPTESLPGEGEKFKFTKGNTRLTLDQAFLIETAKYIDNEKRLLAGKAQETDVDFDYDNMEIELSDEDLKIIAEKAKDTYAKSIDNNSLIKKGPVLRALERVYDRFAGEETVANKADEAQAAPKFEFKKGTTSTMSSEARERVGGKIYAASADSRGEAPRPPSPSTSARGDAAALKPQTQEHKK